MTTDCKVTELFCIIDEFYKHFDAENAGNLLEDNNGVKRRRRAASLSDSETINDMLKNTAQIVHSRHRSVSNFIMNLISALGAYCFFDNKPKALQGYGIEDTDYINLLYLPYFISHYYYIFSYCSDIRTLPNLQELCIFDTLEILSALAVSIANLILFHTEHKCLYNLHYSNRDMVHNRFHLYPLFSDECP